MFRTLHIINKVCCIILCIASNNVHVRSACSKNHQRGLDSMQASLEAEARGKAEAMRMKKKIESDINELEVALDGANRGRAEAEKNIKKCQQQISDISLALEEEHRGREEARDVRALCADSTHTLVT